MNHWQADLDLALAFERLVEAALKERLADLSELIFENGPECIREQAHLDDGTRERAYWHYGYLVALRDVLALVRRQKTTL